MRILLDTSILLWATSGTDRLDAKTTSLLRDETNTILFSAASIWEIAIKAGLQRGDFRTLPTDVLAAAQEAGFIQIPFTSFVASGVAALPHIHRDPFDRFLIAQAMAEPAILLTSDRILTRYTDLVTLVGRQAS